MVALEALLLLVFAGVLLIVQQNLQTRQMAATLRLSASQLNAVIDVQGDGRYLIDPGDAAVLSAQGVLAWILAPTGATLATVGEAKTIPVPATLPTVDQFANATLANGLAVRLLATPLQENGQLLGTLVVALPLRDNLLRLQQLWWSLATAVPIVLLLSAAGGLFLARRALAPVARMTATAQQISAAHLSQRLPSDLPDDEIGRLARTFNTMLERLDHAFQRERQLTSDVAHELRTPIALLKAQLSLARSRPRDAQTLLQMMADMEGDLDRMTHLVEQLLTLAYVEQVGVQVVGTVALAEILAALTERFTPRANEQGIKLRLDIASSTTLQIPGDGERLRQLFTNLIENALKYTPAGGEVLVQAQAQGVHVLVMVRDTGIGIAAEALPHLFERFYRVDSARTRSNGGFGLGLAIVRAIVQAHHGLIDVRSTVAQGTTFTLTLPSLPRTTDEATSQ